MEGFFSGGMKSFDFYGKMMHTKRVFFSWESKGFVFFPRKCHEKAKNPK